MENFKEYYISERGLSPTELLKDLTRIVKFKDKMSKGEPFVGINGTEISFTRSGKDYEYNINILNNLKKRQQVLFRTKEGQLPLRSFLKTTEFGSNRGSGGGAKQTNLTESLQCLYCSLVFNVIKSPISKKTNFEDEDLKKAFESIKVPEKMEKLIGEVSPSWIQSSILIANSLFRVYGKGITGPVIFHRDSEITRKIYNIKTTIFKTQYKGSVFNNNKWNPSDIWMVSTEGNNGINDLNSEEIAAFTIEDFNEKLKSLFNQKSLIGISLKKSQGQATVKTYNLEINKEDKLETFKEYQTHAKKRSFFDSIDVYIETKEGTRIQLRSFNKTNGWQSEIKGKLSSHGKMSLGPINSLFSTLKTSKLLDSGVDVTKMTEHPDKEFYSKFYDLYEKYDKNDSSIKTLEDFINKIETLEGSHQKQWSFRYSKYLGLQFIDILKTSNKQDKIIQGMLKYGLSVSDTSSVFVKVS